MSATLLATKLFVPQLGQTAIERRKMYDRLDEGLQCPLILVSAPVGFGKTTLVAQWIRINEQPSCWLSFDESDNDPGRFLLYVTAALQQIDQDIAVREHAALQAGQNVHTASALIA